MWELRQSLGFTDPLGMHDLPDPPNVRSYLLASTQHSSAPLPLRPAIFCQQQSNPNPHSWTVRALLRRRWLGGSRMISRRRPVRVPRLRPVPWSQNEIIQFAKQYDPVPRHIDEEAAVRSVFGGLTASSAHTFSIFILLTTRLQPRLHVLAGMGWDELKLPNAVRPDDELDLESTVLEMRESKSKLDREIVRTRVLLRNQRRETALECFSNILVARRPDANPPTRTDGGP